MRRHIVGTALFVPLALASAASCSNPGTLGRGLDLEAGAPPGSITGASGDASAEEGGLTEYCAARSCRAPLTTCPTSRFLCDVNLMTDPNNCGECGFTCPAGAGRSRYSCMNGRCQMTCIRQGSSWNADCNGFLDDDCEVTLGSNENCSACGHTCPDPAKPCVFDNESGKGQCGCEPGFLYCGGRCINPRISDEHCNECAHACDPNDGEGAPPVNAYYGCGNGRCGKLKCNRGYADCDGKRDNGCETRLDTEENCGACKVACDEGQTCEHAKNGDVRCMCPPGELLCEDSGGAYCVRPGSDNQNCGGCGVDCTKIGADKHGIGTCSFGTCGYTCAQGWGDCNDDPSDGCETNLGSDQLNCGACGHACDVHAGQPCLAGQCAVEPCSGEGTTR